ncbi:hypothetical protein SBRCBS47491_009122 [Sporothrix bragantina]|uniref:Enoyl reductase (ER) domain-containing protein n=1 Tax=Sporothrix bragantina TaxID=671064 RepID=A0ABP0CTR1_9PEZI
MATASASSLPSSIHAQCLDAYNTPYVYRSIPLPSMETPHDVLIKVDAASYCHTDAVAAAGKMGPGIPESFPLIGCHEYAGTVAALPAGYSGELKIGDRVGVPSRAFHPCTKCFECSSGPSAKDPHADDPGYSVYCPHSSNNGLVRPGGFQEYSIVDDRQVAPIPDDMAATDAAVLMCAGITIYGALKRCNLQPGQRVGIMGCGGGLGHLGLQFASAMGLRVVGIDAQDKPLQLAKETAANIKDKGLPKGCSIPEIIDARAASADEVAKRLGRDDGLVERGEMGLDAVIILPDSQAAFTYGIGLLRNHGLCVLVSFPEKPFEVSAQDIVFRDIRLIGSLTGSNRLLREAVAFATKHNVRAHIRSFPLSKLNDLVEEYHKGVGGKLVIDMTLKD